jgi:hypothetical protein
MTGNEHNPDTNPHWKPKMAYRIFVCRGCGTECAIQTNHTGTVWGAPCHGTCKTIINPNTAREQVFWHKPMPHDYVREVVS